MSVDSTFKHLLHSRNQASVALILLTLSHADWASDLWYVENDTSISSNSLTFSVGRVGITLPSEGDTAGRGALELDNVDSDLTALILAAVDPITVKAQLIMAHAPDTIIKEWPELTWESVQFDSRSASGTLLQEDYERELWPPRVFNEQSFPGSRW